MVIIDYNCLIYSQGIFMAILPVIVGFGGINPAGRSIGHLSYQRLVYQALDVESQQKTLLSLAKLMNHQEINESAILNNTLIRKIHSDLFDSHAVGWNKRLTAIANGEATQFVIKKKQLPKEIPAGWQVSPIGPDEIKVTLTEDLPFLLPLKRALPVSCAGQLPTGFSAAELYQAKNHPRGIQMSVFAASEAIQSIGIEWNLIKQQVPADQISVYAGSSMGQLDLNGNGGMLYSRAHGKKVTSKQCPFGFAEMPADFINAYLLGSMGTTGTNMGACASFLYNLRQGITDIQSGRSQIAIIGNAEAPILPETIDGYSAMGALATDADIAELDQLKEVSQINFTRACRPFSTNKGFTLAESAQYLVLMSDDLAMTIGATVYGAVSDVFINADSFKKSISSPGVGNYVTVAKATAAAKAIVGEKSLKYRSFIQAHGTGTPQNRVTESHILDTVAKAFGIENWLVGAIKSYLGHSIGAAAGDQIIASLGVWHKGIFPGVTSIDHLADDVSAKHLHIPFQHVDIGSENLDIGIINAKGFGGNNASATLLSPHLTKKILLNKHGKHKMHAYLTDNENIRCKQQFLIEEATQGKLPVIYQFNHKVCDHNDVSLSDSAITISKASVSLSLPTESPYSQYCVDE